MAFALVTSGAYSSTDNQGFTTGALTTTGANLLVVGVTHNTGTTPTVSDSKGNSWTKVATKDSGAGAAVSLFYSVPSSVGGSHTFTCSGGAGTFPSMLVAAFSGAKSSSPLDQQNSAQVTPSTSLPVGSVTPSEDNELLVTAEASNVAAISIDSGFTITDIKATVGGAAFGGAFAYLIQTAAAAKNPTWTLLNDNATAIIATFKAAPTALGRMFAVFP